MAELTNPQGLSFEGELDQSWLEYPSRLQDRYYLDLEYIQFENFNWKNLPILLLYGWIFEGLWSIFINSQGHILIFLGLLFHIFMKKN